MQITEIPFVQTVGIVKENSALKLVFEHKLTNHLGTLHASALFTLAESASGFLLQEIFPDLEGKVVPVLRDSSMKFKKPATQSVMAYAFLDDEAKSVFEEQLAKKGRASLDVYVEVKTLDETLCAVATFNWFVQKL